MSLPVSDPAAAPETAPVAPASSLSDRQEGIDRRAAVVAALTMRVQQRQLQVEMVATRLRLAREEWSARSDQRQTRAVDNEERAWLRAEARSLLAMGWTTEELREIGFAPWLPPAEG